MEEYIKQYIEMHPCMQKFTVTDLYQVACIYTSHLCISDLSSLIPANTQVKQITTTSFKEFLCSVASEKLSQSKTFLELGNQLLQDKTYTISFNLEAKNEEAVQSILDSVQGYLLSQAFPANIDFNSLDYTEEYCSATVA